MIWDTFQNPQQSQFNISYLNSKTLPIKELAQSQVTEPCRQVRGHTCSLSRHSPYCPPPKYALTCAKHPRAYLGNGQHGSLQTRKS